MKLKEVIKINCVSIWRRFQYFNYDSVFLFLFIILVMPVNFVGAAENTVHLDAGYLNYVEDKIEVSKGVKIIKEDIVITASRGEVLRKEEKVNLYEGINMNYELGTVDSKEMEGWLKEDKYVFKKDVVFTYDREKTKNEDKGETDEKERAIDRKKAATDTVSSQKMILKAPYLEIYPDKETFFARQGVEINYDKKLIKAEEADYNPEEQTLLLSKNVYIKKENGDWVSGNKAVVYLDSRVDKFTVDGKVEIEIQVNN